MCGGAGGGGGAADKELQIIQVKIPVMGVIKNERMGFHLSPVFSSLIRQFAPRCVKCPSEIILQNHINCSLPPPKLFQNPIFSVKSRVKNTFFLFKIFSYRRHLLFNHILI